MNEKTRDQLDRIRRITTKLAEGAQRAWLFGGWGLDARIGRVTHDHGDIEFWVDRNDALHVRQFLVAAGATLARPWSTRSPQRSPRSTRGTTSGSAPPTSTPNPMARIRPPAGTTTGCSPWARSLTSRLSSRVCRCWR
ncbi:nucleotidyltransferase domain-containing protein [Pseudonocardia nigra]|uniref:nucleotidyltransferase domain-containing protein n=1 Tax=Pseudonocardia nigra TaxID=1921578 RepID=UPI001C5FF615